jgi:hypothetical protein
MDSRRVFAYLVTLAALLGSSHAARATMLRQSCDFRLETWCDVNQTDGPVTIHRFRVTTSEVGIRSISAGSALNDEYLKRVGVQIEYTNESGAKHKSYIKARWLDAEGAPIDGFGDEEGLEANKARGMVKRSIGALKYGLEKAKKIELEVNLNP